MTNRLITANNDSNMIANIATTPSKTLFVYYYLMFDLTFIFLKLKIQAPYQEWKISYIISSWHFAHVYCFVILIVSDVSFHSYTSSFPDSHTTTQPSRRAFRSKDAKHSSLFACCYLMFDLTFTFSFLLISKTYFYHPPKL